MSALWIKQLPSVRGSYVCNDILKKYVWFGVGGPADLVFKPEDTEDLSVFLKSVPSYVPVYILGVGSNVLVRDSGIRGVVVRLGRGFNYIKRTEEGIVVGASTLDRNLAGFAAACGIGGLEFLSTIPGTIGGALRMNAGCYGSEIKDRLLWAKALDLSGEIHIVSRDEMVFRYRSCAVDPSWIFVEACFEGISSTPELITGKMEELLKRREESQPLRSKTGGSTFRNPENLSAWELIDKVGYRGKSLNGAQISEKHCNFLINKDNASAADLEQLGENVRQKVYNDLGVALHWEVVRLGDVNYSKKLTLSDSGKGILKNSYEKKE